MYKFEKNRKKLCDLYIYTHFQLTNLIWKKCNFKKTNKYFFILIKYIKFIKSFMQ